MLIIKKNTKDRKSSYHFLSTHFDARLRMRAKKHMDQEMNHFAGIPHLRPFLSKFSEVRRQYE